MPVNFIQCDLEDFYTVGHNSLRVDVNSKVLVRVDAINSSKTTTHTGEDEILSYSYTGLLTGFGDLVKVLLRC